MHQPLIELDRVSVIRNQTKALDRVTLSIPAGRHTAILGPNGSGKTTFLSLLMRHCYPSIESDGFQGEVKILGRSDWDVFELRRQMGIVNSQLDSRFGRGRTGRMTLTQAVASGVTATELKEFGPLIDQPMQLQIDEAIDLVGMQSHRNQPLATMSTGERRRALIARAIVHQPPVFVLDEPTSGLDIAARQIVLDALGRITQRSGITLVLVTHHVDEIPPSMQHAVLFQNGRMVFDGPKADALTSSQLTRLFGAAVQTSVDDHGWYSLHASSPPRL